MAVTRRQLLKMSGIGSAGVAATSLGALGFDVAFARDRAQKYKLEATTATPSICPYCAVGCGTLVQTRDDANGHPQIVNIEGNPDSPISTGSLCPKGAATLQLALNPKRLTQVSRRAPGSNKWEPMTLAAAMDRVTELVATTRDATFMEKTADGKLINQATGIFALGGATNDNEENYLICKVMRMMGVVRIENQARI
jgi:formate dehydrogenase major subunit